MNVWEKFDKTIDTKGLAQDVQAAAENDREYKEVPFDDYEVRVEKIELKESKKGSPMVSIWFEILAEEYKGSKIFYNQLIVEGFQIHIMNEFLKSLGSGLEIKFETYSQYAKLLENIYNRINGKLEYALEYGKTKKGYATYRIYDVFELTQEQPKKAILEPVEDDDIPF